MGFLQNQHLDSSEQNGLVVGYDSDNLQESYQQQFQDQKNGQNEQVQYSENKNTQTQDDVDIYFLHSHSIDEQKRTESLNREWDDEVNNKLVLEYNSCIATTGQSESEDNQFSQLELNPTIKREKQPIILKAEGKNNAKTLSRALKSFIHSNFTVKQRQMEPFKRFLALKQESCGKQRLEAFLRTKRGNSTGKLFFGNYQWARLFLETSKVDIRSQMKLNEYWLRFLRDN